MQELASPSFDCNTSCLELIRLIDNMDAIVGVCAQYPDGYLAPECHAVWRRGCYSNKGDKLSDADQKYNGHAITELSALCPVKSK